MGLMLDFDRPFSAEDAASFHTFIRGLQDSLAGPHRLQRGVSERAALDIMDALELARKMSAWVADEVLTEQELATAQAEGYSHGVADTELELGRSRD